VSLLSRLLTPPVPGAQSPVSAEVPWSERRISELPGVIGELRSQLVEADRRRTKLLDDLRLQRNTIEARLNAALAELATLKCK
jgi:hypothetical protein